MINVGFSDSQRGGLAVARRELGGNVAGLSFMLEIGSLAEGVPSVARERVIFEQWHHAFDHMEDPSFRAFMSQNRQDLDRVLRAAREGEPIRVWHDEAPASACGLRHLLWAIRDWDCPVSEVALPPKDGAHWQEVPPKRLKSYLVREREIPEKKRRELEGEWARAIRENAPLRVIAKGKLLGAGEDYYDPMIRSCIPEGAFVMGRLIGEILIRHPIGVGDWWYFGRIQKMIAGGELMVLDPGDGEHPYGATLKRARTNQSRRESTSRS